MTKQNTHWNAEVYERIGKPMREWSRAERKLARQVDSTLGTGTSRPSCHGEDPALTALAPRDKASSLGYAL